MKFELRGNAIISNLLVFLFSCVSAGIGLVIWFFMRDTLITILLVKSINKWKLPAVDNFTFLLLGILWLVFVFITHHFYNKGSKIGNLLANFFLISGVQLLLLFLCETIMLIGDQSNILNSLLYMGSEFLIGSILIIIAYRAKKTKPGDKGFTKTN